MQSDKLSCYSTFQNNGTYPILEIVSSYGTYKNVEKRKKINANNGKSRKINCKVLCNYKGEELPGQEFDENGRCINEQTILYNAIKDDIISVDNLQQQSQYDSNQMYRLPTKNSKKNQTYYELCKNNTPPKTYYGPTRPSYGTPIVQHSKDKTH